MKPSWKENIYLQREKLAQLLHEPLAKLAEQCAPAWGDRKGLDAVLLAGFPGIPHCTFLYCVGFDGIQICDNVGTEGLLLEHFGRDRSRRPYMQEAVPAWGFLLSDAYISLMKQRPSLTALQIVRDTNGRPLGYLGADFDLRELPATQALYRQPEQWMQMKGDPAIRAGLFHQERVNSLLDERIDEVLALVDELITVHGVFHAKLHFSSSRATIWAADDPFRYRLHGIQDLSDPNLCLAYPRRDYPADASIPAARVREVLNCFKDLRFMDETLYLRSGSLNIFNGMVGLTFSCDGSHYMPWDEFLDKNVGFWVGASG